MKRTFLLAIGVSAIITSSCAPNNNVIVITRIAPPDSASGICALRTDTLSSSFGTLDLAAGTAPGSAQFYRQFTFDTHFASAGVQTGGIVLEPANREQFLLRSLHLTYRTQKGTAVKTLNVSDDVPLFGNFNGPAPDNHIIVNMLGPKGAAALVNEVPATPNPVSDDAVQVIIMAQLRGVMSGSNAAVRSEAVEYPVLMINSNCAKGPAGAGIIQCPYPGQDGISACKP